MLENALKIIDNFKLSLFLILESRDITNLSKINELVRGDGSPLKVGDDNFLGATPGYGVEC